VKISVYLTYPDESWCRRRNAGGTQEFSSLLFSAETRKFGEAETDLGSRLDDSVQVKHFTDNLVKRTQEVAAGLICVLRITDGVD
jgi:hypothetical protein